MPQKEGKMSRISCRWIKHWFLDHDTVFVIIAAHMLDVGQNEYGRGMSSPSPSGHITPQPPRSPQPMGNNRLSAQPPGRGHPNLTVVIPNSRGEVPTSADQMVS